MIDNHKQICRDLAPAGWSYIGFIDGFYCFQTGDYSKGFKVMKTLDEDLTKENLALMAKLGVTRV